MRLARFTASLAILLYVVRAVQQIIFQPLADPSRVITDDFGVYLRAARALNAAANPYSISLASCHFRVDICGYVYPPLLAELMRPLALLDDGNAGRAWLVISEACVLGAILAIRSALPELRGSAGYLLIAGSLLFFPLYQSLYSLQLGPLLALLLSLAVLAEVRGRQLRAGICVGFAAVLKIVPILVAPVFLRRPFRPQGAAGLVGTIVVALALLTALTASTVEFFTRVLPALANSPARFDNQSLYGFLSRELSLTGAPGWTRAFPPTASALVMIVTFWVSIASRHPRAALLGYAAFIAAMPLASTITWQHHLVTELLAIAVMLALGPSTRTKWMLLAAYPLLWMDPRIVNYLNLLGMVLVWLAALGELRRQATQNAITEGGAGRSSASWSRPEAPMGLPASSV